MYYKFIEIGFWTSASGVYIQNAISNYISEGKSCSSLLCCTPTIILSLQFTNNGHK